MIYCMWCEKCSWRKNAEAEECLRLAKRHELFFHLRQVTVYRVTEEGGDGVFPVDYDAALALL